MKKWGLRRRSIKKDKVRQQSKGEEKAGLRMKKQVRSGEGGMDEEMDEEMDDGMEG